MAHKLPKPKKVNFRLVPPKDGPAHDHIPEPYRLMEEIREKHHPELREANIALAWRLALKRDKDGHLILGKCVKASDLNKEFAPYDFVILLNYEVWHDPEFDKPKKLALLDHELCHADVSLNKQFEKVRDERDRLVWRLRKHDIEEFRAVVERHGCYKRDLEEFAKVLLKKQGKSAELFPVPPEPKTTKQVSAH
jgi:hypothetical protein